MLRKKFLALFILSMSIYAFAACTNEIPCPGDCGEHGECLYGFCVCIDGYSGDLCDIPPDPCDGIDCGANGTCVDGTCECDAGYEGENCETNTDDCAPNPCQNDGICTDEVDSYTCECIDGYTGENCDILPADPIVGVWMYDYEMYGVSALYIFTINDDGSFMWELIIPGLETYTAFGTYTVTSDELCISITDDPDDMFGIGETCFPLIWVSDNWIYLVMEIAICRTNGEDLSCLDEMPPCLYDGGDLDNDTICSDVDNCPDIANPGQADADGDDIGDDCDDCPNDPGNDMDGDGICHAVDICPLDPDNDFDGDTICGDVDNCPDVANIDQDDADNDDVGDDCDDCPDDPGNDFDEDGICGDVDICPLDPDNDFDGDTICGDVDNCPGVANIGQDDADGDDVGDDCDDCDNDPYNDFDGDTICGDVDNCPYIANFDQEDEDNDDMGNACDPCPNDLFNICGSPTLLPAALLSVDSGCVIYIGDHPSEPGQGFIQTIEFCADGTATKWWNPDPVDSPTLPGYLTCDGTWSYNENELTIATTATVMGMAMNTIESYGVAFTYNNGAKLDLSSPAQIMPGDGSTVIGNYALTIEVSVNMGWVMNMLSIADTSLIITGADPAPWTATETTVTTCTGMACPPEGTEVTTTTGTIPLPGELYNLDGTYVIQVDDSLVLDRL